MCAVFRFCVPLCVRGGTGERVGRGGRGRRPREGNDERVEDLNCQGNDQGLGANGGENVGNVLVNVNRVGCSNKEFLAYNPKEYEGKGGALVLTRWIEKMEKISGTLTDEAVRNGSIKKVEKRGNVGETSKDKNGRDDNKRTRTGNVFATTVNPVGRENMGTWSKSACPRLNRAQEPEGNRLNQVAANNEGQGHGNQENQARVDSGADYSLVSTTFIPLLSLEPNNLGFRYEIKIASGQLVEIDKVIKGCKLEIEGHAFDIDLIPFGHGSFDVIIGMDWLSNYNAEIICHEKVVRIPLPDGKVLRVLGERPEEKARFLMGAKAGDKKQEEIVVVRDC
ncbi:putative reverse transcriptase domain-containing protein [Tanacetum coccineum]